MATLMQKLRVVTLGYAHDLLDKRIDMDSPSALRQYVRDIEEALTQMELEAATQAGQVRTLNREKSDLETKITALKTTISSQLGQTGKEELARANATRVIQLQTQLDHKVHELETQTQASANTDKAVANLKTKHDAMFARLNELENLDRDTKVKERSARAMSAAERLVSGGADMSVDSIESKMRARNDIASEQFDRAMGSIQTPEDPEVSNQVDNLLASLKPKATTSAA